MSTLAKALLKIVPLFSDEARLVRSFLKAPQTHVEALTKHFLNRQHPFTRSFGVYYSDMQMVSVNDDIYGFEVKLYSVDELLDCVPSAYGLKKDQAMSLYDAILSCVPRTVLYEEKLRRRIESGQQS